jgi:tripartite-type tricarboxylate transporter receptor subunit TctC
LSRRDQLKNAVALAAAFPFGNLQAQAWPSRSIKIVVPFTPGGTTDYVSRLIGAELAKAIGQPIVVENKPGAGTIIGVDAVAKAAPDGYTFVCVANSFCVNHTLIKKLPYDTLKDFKPVALMGMSEHVLATHPGSGIKQLSDIATLAKSKAGLSYASFGQGTSAHLAGEMLKSQLGLDITHVPYKGQAPALADLLGGQVSLMFGNWPEFRGHIQSGKLVALGMATVRRSSYAPQLPTLKELGVNVESNSWNGLLAPSETPASIVAMLNIEVNKALNSQAVLEAFQKGGIASLSGTSAQFSDFIQSEIKRYGEVIRKGNISAES